MRRAMLALALAAALLPGAVLAQQADGRSSAAPGAASTPAPPAAGAAAESAAAAATATATAAAATQTEAPSGRSLREQMSPEAERRLRRLEEELRCLVCQNQTLADSNADLAVDLRRQVESMVAAGRSDAEIKDYLVDRYGDFVLYRPRLQGNTLALWIGPFALLALGVLAWLLVQRRSARAAALRSEADATARDHARRLLDD